MHGFSIGSRDVRSVRAAGCAFRRQARASRAHRCRGVQPSAPRWQSPREILVPARRRGGFRHEAPGNTPRQKRSFFLTFFDWRRPASFGLRLRFPSAIAWVFHWISRRSFRPCGGVCVSASGACQPRPSRQRSCHAAPCVHVAKGAAAIVLSLCVIDDASQAAQLHLATPMTQDKQGARSCRCP